MSTSQTPRTDDGHVRDSIATKWLMRAVGTGSVVALGYEFTGWGASGFFDALDGPSGISQWLRFVPALLLITAWALTSREESRYGIRAHSGAMAVLAGLSVLTIGLAAPYGLSMIYGVTLLLLAIRTKDRSSIICGIFALLGISFTATGGWAFIGYLLGFSVLMFVAAQSHSKKYGPLHQEKVPHLR